MKKAVLFLTALMAAGIFTAKAQSASDSSYARDLRYRTLNLGNLPITIADTIKQDSNILKDIRIGRRANGFTFVLTGTKNIDIQMVLPNSTWSGGGYMYLLDNTFQIIDSSSGVLPGSARGTRILASLPAGTYHLLTTEYDYSSANRAYSLQINDTAIKALSAIPYTSLGATPTDILYDTLETQTSSLVALDGTVYAVRGYSFTASQNDVAYLYDNSVIGQIIVVLDRNFNIMQSNQYSVTEQLPQNGTYNVLVMVKWNKPFTRNVSTGIVVKTPKTYYIDALNGNDSNSGLTPATALRTLDTAFARNFSVGTFYLTEDYTFGDYNFVTIWTNIYPYQKDIHLRLPQSTPNSTSYRAFFVNGQLVMGDTANNYSFIIDSANNTVSSTIFYGVSSPRKSHVELNNFKIRNSALVNFTRCSDVVIRNCEFTNNNFDGALALFADDGGGSLTMKNSSFRNNYMYHFIDIYKDSFTITMANDTVSDNILGATPEIRNNATLNLTSGVWRNNVLESDFRYNGNSELTLQNQAGIWARNSTINIGPGFVMDPNNYLGIDSTTSVYISGSLTQDTVAALYPILRNERTSLYQADYRSGRTVLNGPANLLEGNFRRFAVAQPRLGHWYLHADGKIYTSPAGINTADESRICLYPNPAGDVLNIALDGTAANEVAIVDIYGKTVARLSVAEGTNSINVGSLAAGIYLVQLRNNDNVVATQKFVKK